MRPVLFMLKCSADNVCYVGGEVTFFITKVYRNSDHQKNLLPLFGLPDGRPEQGLGPIQGWAKVGLHFVWKKTCRL